jgi:Putative prokaryotic signal transducing protein
VTERRFRPEFAEGPLVRVGTARNQAEAELIEGLLNEEGIPTLVRRTGGADVPDFLAAGPREILVPQSGAALARELIGTSEPASSSVGEGTPAWVKALAVALAVAIMALVAAGVFAAVFD